MGVRICKQSTFVKGKDINVDACDPTQIKTMLNNENKIIKNINDNSIKISIEKINKLNIKNYSEEKFNLKKSHSESNLDCLRCHNFLFNQNSPNIIKKNNLNKNENEIKNLKELNKKLEENIKNEKINFNQQINNLKNEINSLKEQLGLEKEKNTKLVLDIDKLKKNEINSLKEQLSEAKEKNTKLVLDIEKLKKNEQMKNKFFVESNEKVSKNKIKLNENDKNKFDKTNKLSLVQLEQKENEIKNKEERLNKKEKKLKDKETELNEKENKIKLKEFELIQRENYIKEIEKKSKVVLIGLNNIGATCYMNATLQCLSNSKQLTEYFLNNYIKDSNKVMANEYYEVLRNLWNPDSIISSYSPNSFKEVLSKENPLFSGIAANDSKDLINFLIERFHQELNIMNSKDINNENLNPLYQPDQTNEFLMLKEFMEEFNQKFNSPISNLFYGVMETKSQCQGCKIVKFNFQVYSFLEFPLQQVNQYYFNNGKRPLFTNDGKNPDVDLYECFEYNRKIDLMTGDNQMYCNQCNKLCDSLYSTILYSGPNYLIINLNRGKGAVYECKVNFPNQLNIFNYLVYKTEISTYELYAVICHLGPSSMNGHFVAYCRNRIDGKWYLYNDAFVTPCTKKYQYNDGMPYILFYRALRSN